MHHFVPILAVQLAEVCGFFFCGFLLESAFSVDENVTGRGVLFNCAYSVCYQAFNVSGGVLLAVWISGLVGRAPFHGFLSSAISRCGFLPVSLLLGIGATVVNDFFLYWLHRAQHFFPWLWAQHELHHTEQHLNVTTTLRHHWLEVPLRLFFVAAPLALLFDPPPMSVAVSILMWGTPGYFLHLNSRIRFGALGWVISCPQIHRIHHSIEPRHIDKNFSGICSFWDVLFGTYYHPAPDEWPETGLASGKTVTSISYALVMPFVTWTQMLRRRI